MRLIIIAAVNQRAESCCNLNHGHIKVLSERVRRKVRDSHVLRTVYQAVGFRLVCQINICLEAKPENILKMAEGLLAHRKSLLHQSNVAGAFDRLPDCQNAVTVCIVTFDRLSTFRNGQRSLTKVCLIRPECTALEAGPCRKRLCNRTRFVVIRNAEVLPESIEILRLLLVRQRIHILLGEIVVLHRGVVVLEIEFCHSDERVRIVRIIQVEPGITRHREHISVVRIHDNDTDIAGAVSCTHIILVRIVELLEIFLTDALNVRIQGQNEIVPALT